MQWFDTDITQKNMIIRVMCSNKNTRTNMNIIYGGMALYSYIGIVKSTKNVDHIISSSLFMFTIVNGLTEFGQCLGKMGAP